VHAQIFNALPDEKSGPIDTMVAAKAASKTIRDLKSTQKVLACKAGLSKDIDSVCGALQAIQEGVSPTTSETNRLSSFFNKVLGRCQYYCSVKFMPKSSASSMFPAEETLVGFQAVLHMYKEFDATRDAEGEPKYIRELRTYSWLLSTPQRALIEKTVRAFVSMQKTAIADRKAIADCVSEEIVVHGASSSSTALATSSLTGLRVNAKVGKKPVATEPETHAEKKSKLLAMFAPRDE
jgi:hypothetical protein